MCRTTVGNEERIEKEEAPGVDGNIRYRGEQNTVKDIPRRLCLRLRNQKSEQYGIGRLEATNKAANSRRIKYNNHTFIYITKTKEETHTPINIKKIMDELTNNCETIRGLRRQTTDHYTGINNQKQTIKRMMNNMMRSQQVNHRWRHRMPRQYQTGS